MTQTIPFFDSSSNRAERLSAIRTAPQEASSVTIGSCHSLEDDWAVLVSSDRRATEDGTDGTLVETCPTTAEDQELSVLIASWHLKQRRFL